VGLARTSAEDVCLFPPKLKRTWGLPRSRKMPESEVERLRRELEQERREEEDARTREEHERRKKQNMTLGEYLYNCHHDLYQKLDLAHPSQPSTGFTKVDGKYYPKWLRPWDVFKNTQWPHHLEVSREAYGGRRLLHQVSTTRDLVQFSSVYSYSVAAAMSSSYVWWQVLADSRNVHPVHAPLHLLVGKRPAVPRIPTNALCYLFLRPVQMPHVVFNLFVFQNVPSIVFQSVLFGVGVVYLSW